MALLSHDDVAFRYEGGPLLPEGVRLDVEPARGAVALALDLIEETP